MDWLLHVFRPLTVDELQDALALESEGSVGNVISARAQDLKGDLERLFGPLVRVTATVDLRHQTVKDYFLREAEVSQSRQPTSPVTPTESHVRMARVCILSMASELSVTDGSTDYRTGSARNSTDTLAFAPPIYTGFKNYAVRWGRHHRSAAIDRGDNAAKIAELDEFYERIVPAAKQNLDLRVTHATHQSTTASILASSSDSDSELLLGAPRYLQVARKSQESILSIDNTE